MSILLSTNATKDVGLRRENMGGSKGVDQ